MEYVSDLVVRLRRHATPVPRLSRTFAQLAFLCGLIVLLLITPAQAQQPVTSPSLTVLKSPVIAEPTAQTIPVEVISPVSGELQAWLVTEGEQMALEVAGNSALTAGVPRSVTFNVPPALLEPGVSGTFVLFVPGLQVYTYAFQLKPILTGVAAVVEKVESLLPRGIYILAFLAGLLWVIVAWVKLPKIAGIDSNGGLITPQKARPRDFVVGQYVWSPYSRLPNFPLVSAVITASVPLWRDIKLPSVLTEPEQYIIVPAVFTVLTVAALGLLNAVRRPVLKAANQGSSSAEDQGSEYKIGWVLVTSALLFAATSAEAVMVLLVLAELSYASIIPWEVGIVAGVLLLCLWWSTGPSSIDTVMSTVALNGRQATGDHLPELLSKATDRHVESMVAIAEQLPPGSILSDRLNGSTRGAGDQFLQPTVAVNLTAAPMSTRAEAELDVLANAWLRRITSRIPVP